MRIRAKVRDGAWVGTRCIVCGEAATHWAKARTHGRHMEIEVEFQSCSRLLHKLAAKRLAEAEALVLHLRGIGTESGEIDLVVDGSSYKCYKFSS